MYYAKNKQSIKGSQKLVKGGSWFGVGAFILWRILWPAYIKNEFLGFRYILRRIK